MPNTSDLTSPILLLQLSTTPETLSIFRQIPLRTLNDESVQVGALLALLFDLADDRGEVLPVLFVPSSSAPS